MPDPVFFPTLTTARLYLTPLTREDAEPLFHIFSNPAVMKYWNTPPWASLQDAVDCIANSHQAMTRQTALTLGIRIKGITGNRESHTLAGMCMLFNYHALSQRAELGFGLDQPMWGRGYIGEAAQAVIEYGFQTLRLRRIEAEINPDNRASARALEKLGFQREGLLRQRWQINGVVSDSAVYGRLATDA